MIVHGKAGRSNIGSLALYPETTVGNVDVPRQLQQIADQKLRMQYITAFTDAIVVYELKEILSIFSIKH